MLKLKKLNSYKFFFDFLKYPLMEFTKIDSYSMRKCFSCPSLFSSQIEQRISLSNLSTKTRSNSFEDIKFVNNSQLELRLFSDDSFKRNGSKSSNISVGSDISVIFDETYHYMETTVEEEAEKYPEICAQKEKLLDMYRQAISGWSRDDNDFLSTKQRNNLFGEATSIRISGIVAYLKNRKLLKPK